MTDTTTIQTDDNTPEYVAYKLLEAIAVTEDKRIYGMRTQSGSKPNKKWILDTYAECLDAVTGKRYIEPK